MCGSDFSRSFSSGRGTEHVYEIRRVGNEVPKTKRGAVDKFDEAHEELKARGLVEE